MPVCRSTLGALARSRPAVHFPASKTLVPFLYQTPTIQQWQPTTQPSTRRNAHSSSRPPPRGSRAPQASRTQQQPQRDYYDIPFEDADSLPPSIEDPFAPEAAPVRPTTLTGSERDAFTKLYKKASDEEQIQKERRAEAKTDRIVDDIFEEEDDFSDPASLDSVFDAVLAGQPAPRKRMKTSPFSKQPETLKTLAEKILKPEANEARRKSQEQKAEEVARLKEIREEERSRVQILMEAAQTDRELWEILEREVFSIIRELDLDTPKATKKQAARTESNTPFPTSPTSTPWEPNKKTNPRYDPRILFPNFPVHLTSAVELLRKSFPSSPLPLSLLPAIKSLGRSSYALGATTKLYNQLIRTVWIQYADYAAIDELISDMDNGGIEFDSTTLSLLDEISAENRDVRNGRYGAPLQKIFNMEQFYKDSRKLVDWRNIAAERSGLVVRKTYLRGEA